MSNCSKIYSNSEKPFYQALKNNYDAYSQFELGKRFGEMILSKCY